MQSNSPTKPSAMMKFIVVGAENSGKSTLIHKYANPDQDAISYSDNFLSRNPTQKTVSTNINDVNVTQVIWDIPADVFKTKAGLNVAKGAHGFMLAVDLTKSINTNSEEIKKIITFMKEKLDYSETAPLILVGTKSDLKGKLCTTNEDAKKLATELGCTYFETNAKEGFSIANAFESLCKLVIDKKPTFKNVKELMEKEKPNRISKPNFVEQQSGEDMSLLIQNKILNYVNALVDQMNLISNNNSPSYLSLKERYTKFTLLGTLLVQSKADPITILETSLGLFKEPPAKTNKFSVGAVFKKMTTTSRGSTSSADPDVEFLQGVILDAKKQKMDQRPPELASNNNNEENNENNNNFRPRK